MGSVDVLHPGIRIRAVVIPQGMSVTKAAQLTGVGRPALSNLLNGNASLSADMATRLEKAFGYPRTEMMKMQAEFDSAEANKKNAPTKAQSYVPPFLSIRSNEITHWIDHNISARARLSVLLRMLVHSTGIGLTKVDFPGNDDAERPGWDGFVEADEATPWIPVGRSGWEFGVNENVKKKADGDFSKSVIAIETQERLNSTFVFVTPRRWVGKNTWLAQAKAKGLWRDIRVYDASDLEQWIEQSIPAQAWFANELQIPAQDVRSLDKCWADWANVASPPLTGALFSSAIEETRRTMQSLLSKPSHNPILIAADSTEEALAFLAQIFSNCGGSELAVYRDRILIFDKPGVLPRLVQGVQTFIPVVSTREVERELAAIAKSMPSIVVYPRNAASTEPDIVLEPTNDETFNKAMKEMGKERDEVDRLANESGRSLTVLRRRLATFDVVRTPQWAANHAVSMRLVPLMFVGAWQVTNEADRSGLSLLAGDRPYEEIERDILSLTQLNDAPVWSIGTYRGVTSKIDLLFAIARVVTSDDLHRYFSLAGLVLGDDDPALDLDEDKRWAAAIYGKMREFSGAFRQGISETLVLLAVHGEQLFEKRLGFDPGAQASLLVRATLRTPLTTRILEANDRDLPTYAEAAPDEFLSILERDLNTDHPAVLGLLRPVDAGAFGSSPVRTGLLWALEGLSWSRETLPRAVFILARLAQIEINDNWINKPMHSLRAIFRAWMPQTAANHEMRVQLVKKLASDFPDVAWKICVSEFGADHEVGHYSHKPRWRPEGFGFGEPLPMMEPIMRFRCEMVEMALSWKDHTLHTLTDMLRGLYNLDDAFQARVWALIEAWAKAKASDSDKAAMREHIRIAILSRGAVKRAKKKKNIGKELTIRAKAAYVALEPSDLIQKHAWLFRETWLEESADEIEDVEIDFQRREARIQNMRIDAMRDVLSQRGLTGLLELAECGKASWQVGFHASQDLLSEAELVEMLRLTIGSVFDSGDAVCPFKNLFSGAMRATQDIEKRKRVMGSVARDLLEEDTARLLLLTPFSKSIWTLVDGLRETAQNIYWSRVVPEWLHYSDAENNEGVERLLKANRPRAAFSCVSFHPEKLDAQVLSRLLLATMTGTNEKPGEYLLRQYDVEQAFQHLNASPTLTLDQKAGMELAFLDVLARPWDNRHNHYGIPNLERYVDKHPELIVQAIVWAYKRRDGGTDPAEFQVSADRISSMAERGYKLIEALKNIPGHDHFGVLQAGHLAIWIAQVRQACAALDRTDIADHCIGKIMTNAPVGKDGVWPCEPVREVMENAQSEPMMQGAHMGVYNSRGAHWRGNGGDQERELASKYRAWSQAIQLSHPYVSARLLSKLAKTYEDQADQQDVESDIRRRLR